MRDDVFRNQMTGEQTTLDATVRGVAECEPPAPSPSQLHADVMISNDQLTAILATARSACAASRLGWGVYTGLCLGAPFGFSVKSDGTPYQGGHFPAGMDPELYLARLMERLLEDDPPRLQLLA